MKPLIIILFALPLYSQHIGIETLMLDLPIDKKEEMEKLKWCIKRTPENADEINSYANKRGDQKGKYFGFAGYYYNEPVTKYTEFTRLSGHNLPNYHEITIHEFRLLTNPERYRHVHFFEDKDNLWTPKSEHGITNEIALEIRAISSIVVDEWVRMWKEKQSHYSANPEVTTTLDPLTEYKTKGPDGIWSFDFAEENQKATQLMKGVISELDYLIKVQKKALKQSKKLRDKLNAETNY
jgi:hypothetical protein